MSGWVPIAVLAVAPLVLVSAQGPPQVRSDRVADELVVQFSRSSPSARRAAILSAENAQEIRQFERLDIFHVRLPQGRNVELAVAAFLRHPDVIAAQPNYLRQIVRLAGPLPNDPRWLDGTLWGLSKIQAPPVWTGFGTGDGTVVIADVDTGVNYNHPDLAANMWRNPGEIPGNGIDDDANGKVDDVFGIDTRNNDTDPMDDNGHGTFTSGIAAAVGNNGIGVTGVNWNAKILACKFLNQNGSGSDADAIACFNYILALKQRGINIRVVNNSWGGFRGPGPPPTAMKNAIDALGAAGILSVFSAGNDGVNIDSTPFDPASITSSSIVSVAASDQSDNRANFSNFGATAVDIAAPGVSITSTFGNDYLTGDGTSASAPYVAGAAALLASLDPSLSVDSIKFALLDRADRLTQWNGVVASGGRLNLNSATIAISPAPLGRIHVALAANGGVATGSSTYNGGYAAAGAINGDRRGQSWGNGGGWNDGTADTWPDWLEISFNGAQTINEVDVFSVQDNYSAPSEPTSAMTFSLYGLRDFQIQYWTGSAWLTVPTGAITINNLVWRQVTFSPVTTTKIRIWVTNGLNTWSRITEVEAYTSDGSPTNSPPSATLTAPANNSTYTAPASIDLTATASDTDGTVTSVAFYADGNLIGTDATSPYAVNWPNVPAGSYVLTAVATDDDGSTGPSTAVNVTVNPAPPPPGRINVALAANGGVAAVSSAYNGGYAAAGAINGDRRGQSWGNGGGWNDGTPDTWPDWLEISFNGAQTINEVDVFSVQDSYASPSEPTLAMTFSLYGLRDFQIQYWTGSAWLTVPTGAITSNNLVWRQVTFSPVTTTKIRIWVTNGLSTWSRITEVEAYTTSGGPLNNPPSATLTAPANNSTYTAPASIDLTATAGDTDGTVTSVAFYANGNLIGTDATSPYALNWPNVPAGSYVLTAVATDNGSATGASASVNVTVNPAPPPPGRINVALAANGGVATGSSTHSSGYAAAGAINGDRRGQSWGNGGGWNDGTANTWPDSLEIAFNGAQTIDEIDVFSVQDNYAAPSEPTSAMTFSLYGLRDFQIQYWTGSAWLTVPTGTISNNSLVWRQVTFAPITTTKIRIWVTNGLNTWSRITEVEAYSTADSPDSPPVISPSTMVVRADLVGTLAPNNPTSPLVAGSQLLLINQRGYLYRWDGTTAQPLLTPATSPAGIDPFNGEATINAAANAAGSIVYVMFTSTTLPAGIPQMVSPRPANNWQVLYRYTFNGTSLSNPVAIVAFQVNAFGHTGGGMVVLADGTVLFATGDNGDSGEDGREYAQDPGNHLSKILRIDPVTAGVTVVAVGVRNVQRLIVNPNGGDPRLEFVDLGGSVAEELNSVRIADLLAAPIENFGWGRNAIDNLAREGTFYIDFGGAVTGAAPTPEAGFMQPVAQFGREGAQLVGVTGPVSSAVSFTNITSLFGDLDSGNVLAVIGAPGTPNQTVYRVNLVDNTGASVTLSGLAGGRPDPRFFLFPDGTAGVLLERTGAFYRLTQISQ